MANSLRNDSRRSGISELEKDNPSADRVQRFLNRIKELAPSVQGIVKAAAAVARLVGLA